MTHAERVAAPFPLFVSESPDIERLLVHRAQDRDASAFEQLYRLHLRRVYSLCLRFVASPARAEELTQQAFLTAWEELPQFRGDSAFASWLHRLTVNVALADLRAQQRRERYVFGSDDPAAFETASAAPSVGERLDLEQAIALLPPHARAIFILHDVEGWQHHEIGEKLGIASGTSKAQLHRARQLLQEALR
jgi:RNA polymerase sigma-70 factor (ECF subfamily)